MGEDLAIPNDDASGAATENNLLSSADFSDGYKAIADPEDSAYPCEPSLHSRDNSTIHSIDQRNDQKEKNGNKKMYQVNMVAVKSVSAWSPNKMI